VKRALAVAALAVALTGCASANDDDPTLSAQPDVAQPSAAAPRAAGCASGPPAAQTGADAQDLSKKPQIEIPDSPPPCTLGITEVVVGKGAEATPGKTITVKYVGVTYATGKEFDASWGSEDFTFPLGAGRVIQGWDQGFAGMKEGGRRQLVIPPELGYGDRGAGADIPPGATLIFVVDLVKVS
jgi:peptidylprolyl isomerase